MPFNVNTFRSSFFSGGEPTSPAAFEVRVVGFPQILPSSVARDLIYRCESASLPAKTLQTIDRRTYGAIRKIAYAASYEEITLSFIVSSDMSERNFFSAWQSWIIDSGEGGDISYYDDYVGQIQIATYDHKGNENLLVTLVEAYPVSVNSVPLTWGDTNQYMKLDVTFAFRYWTDAAGGKYNGFGVLLGSLGNTLQLTNNLKQLRNQLRGGSTMGKIGALIAVANGGIQAFDQAVGAIPQITTISPSIGRGVSQVTQRIGAESSRLSQSFKSASSGLISKARSAFSF